MYAKYRVGRWLERWPSTAAACDASAASAVSGCVTSSHAPDDKAPPASSLGRPCRYTNGRSKRTYELTSSIVPRGTSFHGLVELEYSPIVIDPAWLLCRRDLPGPTELSAINPYAVHDHGQSAR